MEQTARVPITLLTGFLGAGKTTRLNKLLASGQVRVAVIENEIGALSVDSSLVANHHEDGVIELVNGCLCCSAEVDLVAALEALALRRSSRPFDQVVIETTGLADVGPVVSLLCDRDDPLSQTFFFAGVVTVVDAVALIRWAPDEAAPPMSWVSGFGGNFSPHFAGGSAVGLESARLIFWRQVAFADRLVISKADLVQSDALNGVQAALPEANPLAEVMVDALGDNTSTLLMPEPLLCRQDTLPREYGLTSSAKRFCSAYARSGTGHMKGIDVLTLHLRPDLPLDAVKFEVLAKKLLQGTSLPVVASFNEDASDAESVEAWRLKGVLPISERGLVLVQGVHDILDMEDYREALTSGPFLVIIGVGLRKVDLEGAVGLCADTPLATVKEM